MRTVITSFSCRGLSYLQLTYLSYLLIYIKTFISLGLIISSLMEKSVWLELKE